MFLSGVSFDVFHPQQAMHQRENQLWRVGGGRSKHDPFLKSCLPGTGNTVSLLEKCASMKSAPISFPSFPFPPLVPAFLCLVVPSAQQTNVQVFKKVHFSPCIFQFARVAWMHVLLIPLLLTYSLTELSRRSCLSLFDVIFKTVTL